MHHYTAFREKKKSPLTFFNKYRHTQHSVLLVVLFFHRGHLPSCYHKPPSSTTDGTTTNVSALKKCIIQPINSVTEVAYLPPNNGCEASNDFWFFHEKKSRAIGTTGAAAAHGALCVIIFSSKYYIKIL